RALGRATCSKKKAYQGWTSGLGPWARSRAAFKKLRTAAPASAPVQPGLPTLPSPAVSHCQPSHMRSTNHKGAERVSATRNLTQGGSLKGVVKESLAMGDHLPPKFAPGQFGISCRVFSAVGELPNLGL